MRTDVGLGVILVVQLGLVAWTWSGDGAELVPETDLVGLQAQDVTRLEVARTSETDGPESVVLERAENGWILASHGGYPADSGKVGTLLDSLLGIRVSAPVTTSPTSHTQLQVAAETHDKRVRIEAGQTVELLVGAGGKDAHVRRADQDEVHVARGLSPWSLGTTPSQYHDPIYLSLDMDTVASVEFQCSGDENVPLQLERSGDAWVSPALEAEQSLDSDSVDALMGKLASVRIAALPEDPAATPLAVCTVSWVIEEEGESVVGSLVIGAEEEGRRRVGIEGNPHSVMVSSYGVEPLVNARLEGLVASEDDTGAPMLLPAP